MNNKTIGQIVKENRKKLNLTQKELAMYACVSPKFIIELENDKKTIQLDKLYDVLNILDLTITITRKASEE